MSIKIIRNFSRFIIGLVFIFSGFVKAIDPLGSTYKFSDYFEAFGLDFLNGLSLVFALLLSGAELVIGLCIFFKLRMRAAAWALLIFMGYFTILTLFSALTNPVTDCGCFGDALILTNWQTFFKNLIFLVPTLIVFLQRSKFENSFSAVNEWLITGSLFVLTLLLSIYCLRNLPLIDFRPYKIGADIQAGMEIPEGEPLDKYETVLVYEKDGVEKEFSLDSPEQPWSDSTWTWVETKNLLISKGYEPPIHDFNLTSAEGGDYTDDLLNDTAYSFLVVAYDLQRSNREGLRQIGEFTKQAIEKGYRIYGMTASVNEIIEQTYKEYQLPFEFYTTDDITLKTMIRSNPGLMLIKDGVVIGKWHHRNIPDDSFFSKGAL